jgi:hypothetical protein
LFLQATEEQFSASYPNVRTVAIKKGNQSLGIMIIEGKHAEVGQGIFISDIQEGSFAEKVTETLFWSLLLFLYYIKLCFFH